MGKSLLYEFYIEFIPKCNQALLTETADVCLRTIASGGDDVTSSVSLTLNFERQLVASTGYEALCDSQEYEIYIGDSSNPFLSLEVMPDAGDARRAWIMNPRTGMPYTGRLGDDQVYGIFSALTAKLG